MLPALLARPRPSASSAERLADVLEQVADAIARTSLIGASRSASSSCAAVAAAARRAGPSARRRRRRRGRRALRGRRRRRRRRRCRAAAAVASIRTDRSAAPRRRPSGGRSGPEALPDDRLLHDRPQVRRDPVDEQAGREVDDEDDEDERQRQEDHPLRPVRRRRHQQRREQLRADVEHDQRRPGRRRSPCPSGPG